MSELLGARKYVAGLVAAGIGGLSLTGCASTATQTWEIGVVCPKGSDVEVGYVNTDTFGYGADITILCANELGEDVGVTSMELTKGQGSVINSNKEYTNTVEIKYEDVRGDGSSPEISMAALTGFVYANNVNVESVAVTE